MKKKQPIERREKPLPGRSVLCDRFIPNRLRQINLSPVATRWVLCAGPEGGGVRSDGSSPASSPDARMDVVVAKMAENFIPRVPCLCGNSNGNQQAQAEPVHGHYFYAPSQVHRVPPDLLFAISHRSSHPPRYFAPADLDESDSIQEYASTFRGALRLEHEERMRMYEKFSLFEVQIKRFDPQRVDVASVSIDGIADARPSLQVGDLALLRPIQPLAALVPNQWGTMEAQPYTVEVESRVLQIVRGKGGLPDHVVISWNLAADQRDALQDSAWARQYAVRFLPSSTSVERCLTAMDWLENLSLYSKEAMKDVLFPVHAPNVKPLSATQRKVSAVVPSKNGYSTQLDISDIGKPLNERQASFVTMVRSRTQDPSLEKTRPPMILTGPAGTGKTKTLIYAIADVLGILHPGPNGSKNNTNRVLLCCPSHAACDVLARRLSGLLKRSEIFRMYDSTRPSNTVPSYILPFTCQIPGSDRFTFPLPHVWGGFKAVICTCMDAHLLFRAQVTNNAIRCKQQCFRTFLLSENSPLGLTFGQLTVNDDPFFTHLFVDEAAQATEPEILIPMSCVIDPHLLGRKVEMALIGDPRQLSPRAFAPQVADSLGRSFMERLLRRPVTCMGGGEESLLGPTDQPDSLLHDASSITDLIRYYASVDGQEQLTVFLTENYRAHPSFLMMPSSFYYFDRLKSAKKPDPDALAFWCVMLRKVEAMTSRVDVSIESPDGRTSPMTDMFSRIKRQTTWPIHFRGVKGADTSDALEHFSGTDSWKNIMEAHTTVQIISTLIENGVEPKRIGAMSPFRGQVVTIRKMLRHKYFHDVNVGTIENYQAVEQDVIILSLTRSSSDFMEHDVEKRIGVFGQPKQANVAMTRAECLFVVVGHPDTMWKDPCWRQWLRFCCRNGLWYGEGLEQWKDTRTISLKDMKCVPVINFTGSADDGNNSLVVSTLEKIHRRHQD